MAAGNFEQCLALVLREEGGYVNDPRDPGGRTNHGVTQAVWEAFIGKEVTESDMQNLTVQDVGPLYRAQYWDKIRGDELPDGIDYAVFDFAVNSGVGRAAKVLQTVVGVTVDGQIGQHTIDACKASNARDIATQVCEKRIDFLQGLPTWDAFGKGWGGRVSRVETISFQMGG